MPAQYPLRSLDRAVLRQHILRETGHKTVNGPLTMFFRGWRAISGMPGSRFTSLPPPISPLKNSSARLRPRHRTPRPLRASSHRRPNVSLPRRL